MHEFYMISGKEMLMSAEVKGCVMSFICFLDFFRYGMTMPGFIIVGYV